MNPQQANEQPEYAREESGYYPYNQTLTANQPLTDQTVQIDGDSDFLILGLASVQNGAFRLNFKANNGRYISQSSLLNANICGTGEFPVTLPKPMIVPARGRIGVDIQDVSGSNNTIEVVFIGIRLYRE